MYDHIYRLCHLIPPTALFSAVTCATPSSEFQPWGLMLYICHGRLQPPLLCCHFPPLVSLCCDRIATCSAFLLSTQDYGETSRGFNLYHRPVSGIYYTDFFPLPLLARICWELGVGTTQTYFVCNPRNATSVCFPVGLVQCVDPGLVLAQLTAVRLPSPLQEIFVTEIKMCQIWHCWGSGL